VSAGQSVKEAQALAVHLMYAYTPFHQHYRMTLEHSFDCEVLLYKVSEVPQYGLRV
jgi:hypothetical protein